MFVRGGGRYPPRSVLPPRELRGRFPRRPLIRSRVRGVRPLTLRGGQLPAGNRKEHLYNLLYYYIYISNLSVTLGNHTRSLRLDGWVRPPVQSSFAGVGCLRSFCVKNKIPNGSLRDYGTNRKVKKWEFSPKKWGYPQFFQNKVFDTFVG